MMHQATGHIDAGTPALAQAAEQALQARGIQWTKLRAKVFDALAEGGTPVSAYDVADRVTALSGRRVAPNSIYRILDLFVANNLAKRVESRNAYIANTHPFCQHDCIFLVCNSCGTIEHLDDDQLANAMRQRAGKAGFQPARPVLEVLGQCSTCQAGGQSSFS